MGAAWWVHEHVWWLMAGVVPCAAAICWGLWAGRYQPTHAGAARPVTERWVPWETDPRFGSMQLAEDVAWPLCHSCGSSTCPAAGKPYVDECPLWQEAEQRNARGEWLQTRPVDWRDQTRHDLAPAVLDSGPGGPSLAPGPDPERLEAGRASRGKSGETACVPTSGGALGQQGVLATPTTRPPDPEHWWDSAGTSCPECGWLWGHSAFCSFHPEDLTDAEPEPERTVAGRLVETSGEWLRRLERDAGPGWTYAGVAA